ncbi:MAG: MlaC/ttg2D family ABC transporter substrate-binding protein, partial [Pseudomonadales bacterium]
SRGVMAKHYRKATKQQRHTFQQSFRLALVKTYARSLVEFDNERVVVLPPKRSDLKADKATIKLEIHSKTGNIFPVQYQLVRRDGKWLLRNLIVGGINIGLQFRSQFGAFMQRYRNDIDKVIANWSVDV